MSYKSKYNWKEEVATLKELAQKGKTLQEIGNIYGLTRERIRQIFSKYNIENGQSYKRKEREKRHYLKRGNTEQDKYSIKRKKFSTKKANAKRMGYPFTLQFGEIEWPTHCPILGLELDYLAEERQENSPSIDQINPSKGYIPGNVRVISWRANRIKNDGTAEEHNKIALWLSNLL